MGPKTESERREEEKRKRRRDGDNADGFPDLGNAPYTPSDSNSNSDTGGDCGPVDSGVGGGDCG